MFLFSIIVMHPFHQLGVWVLYFTDRTLILSSLVDISYSNPNTSSLDSLRIVYTPTLKYLSGFRLDRSFLTFHILSLILSTFDYFFFLKIVFYLKYLSSFPPVYFSYTTINEWRYTMTWNPVFIPSVWTKWSVNVQGRGGIFTEFCEGTQVYKIIKMFTEKC